LYFRNIPWWQKVYRKVELKNTNERKEIRKYAQKNGFVKVKNLARYRSENNFIEPSNIYIRLVARIFLYFL